MRNIKLLLQYEGTKYQGWQRQTSTENTIQGKLEKLLSKMCDEPIELIGSGRTDAGVHAMGQVANFHTSSDMPLENMLSYINQYLPQDIAVIEISQAAPRFHSRLNASGKCYCYHVINSDIPNVFYRNYALQVPQMLDVLAMEKAAQYLLGEHDFKSFTSTKKSKKSTVRRIDEIKIEKQGDIISFTFTGSGFLYHMIRILMGTLLEVGRGERKAEDMEMILASQKREFAGALVPAKGLVLKKVYF